MLQIKTRTVLIWARQVGFYFLSVTRQQELIESSVIFLKESRVLKQVQSIEYFHNIKLKVTSFLFLTNDHVSKRDLS